MSIASYLQASGKRTAVISLGVSLHEPDYAGYRAAGGRLLMGDQVTGGVFDGGRLKAVHTLNLASTPLEADKFVICTGKYLSKGLVADMDSIYEPALGLDVEYDTDRDRWFSSDFSSGQRFLGFGLSVDEGYHPRKDGVTIENLFAAGEILAGVDITGEGAVETIGRQALEVAGKIVE